MTAAAQVGPGLSTRLFARLRDASYLRKWLILGSFIGVVAGLGAVVFSDALTLATHLILGGLAGYRPPAPIGEGNTLGSTGFPRPWLIPLLVGAGGLVSGLIVFGLAPEAEGHGTDAAIHAFHHNPRGIRRRVSLIKVVASAITIGSGGSGGREGPTAQISASFGSYLSRLLNLSPADSRIAIAVGIGSGIGSIFRAPLGGAVLGAEILYRDDFEVEALIPSLIASIVGFAVFGAINGFSPIFGFLKGYEFNHPVELFYYGLLGVTAGLVGRVYAKVFYGATDLTARIPLPRAVKPGLAGILVGCMALALPGVLGTGYGWVQVAMGPGLLALPLWVVLLLPLAKIVATSMSIGSGGSGGIFGPGMVVGGFTGAAMWRLLEPFAPGLPHNPAPFVIVGMIACFGSIAHAPLAVMLMVSEMTGTLAILPPAMVAVGLATVVVGDRTIYTSQLKSRADSPAHRFRFGMPILESMRVSEAMMPPRLVMRADATLTQAAALLHDAGLSGGPVVGSDERFLGALYLTSVGDRADPSGTRLADLVGDEDPVVAPDAGLGDVLDVFATREISWVTVVEAGRVVGVVGTGDLMRAYRGALESGLRKIAGLGAGSQLLEAEVAPGSVVSDRQIRDVTWPGGTLVVSLERKGNLLTAAGDTELKAGDKLSAICRPEHEQRLRQLLGDPGKVEDTPGGAVLV